MPERAFAMHFRSAKGNTDDLPAVGEEPLNGRSSYQDAGTRDEETAIPFRIEHNQGPLDLEMRVRYQACSETVCHPPGNSAFVCRCRGRPGVTHRPGGSNSRAVTGWPPSTAGSPAATCSCSPAAWGETDGPGRLERRGQPRAPRPRRADPYRTFSGPAWTPSSPTPSQPACSPSTAGPPAGRPKPCHLRRR